MILGAKVRTCNRTGCSNECQGRDFYCTDACRAAEQESRAAARKEAREAATALERGYDLGYIPCEREGCNERKEPGRYHLCARHGRTADLIATQRVPIHQVQFMGVDLVVRCARCKAMHVVAVQPSPEEARRARYQAQVWACEHDCQVVP